MRLRTTGRLWQKSQEYPKITGNDGRDQINSDTGRTGTKANELEEDLTRPLTEEERRLQAESEKESSFIHFFIPRKGFIATPVLIDINILVFILMAATGAGILEPSTLALLNWGADFGPLTLTGDWWRAVTCNFVHIGAFHLLMNMYAFIYIGIWHDI